MTTPFDVVQLVIRIVLAVTFVGMGVLHFLPTLRRGMARMIPPRLRLRGAASPTVVVTITGVMEVAGGFGLLVPPVQTAAGICLAVYLVAVFPANVYAAQHPDRFGAVAIPFWPRLALQIVLIALCIIAIV